MVRQPIAVTLTTVRIRRRSVRTVVCRYAATIVLIVAAAVGVVSPTAQAAPPNLAAPADPAQCGAELPGGRCAEPGLPPGFPEQHLYGTLDFHWIPQPASVTDSHLLSDALRIPSLLRQGCQDYPDNGRSTDGGEAYASYVAAEAGLLKFLERPAGRAALVRALSGSPGISDAGGSRLPGGYVDVKGLSYKNCLDLLAPNWRNTAEKLDTKPGWKRVIFDLIRIPALIGQPGTDGAEFCHTDQHHTDWDFTMAYVIRTWGMIRTEPDENLFVTGDTLKDIFAIRAWLQGPAGDIDHLLCDDAFPNVPETENHEWLIRTTRLLHNELLPALDFRFPNRLCGSTKFSCHYPGPFPCDAGQACVPKPECDPVCQDDRDGLPWPQAYYTGNNTNNDTNGLSSGMQATMSDLLSRDWVEYNARPYSRAQIVGLLNLYDFSTNAETRRLAGRLLDFAAVKHVAESMNNLRIAPYRRRTSADDSNLFSGGMTGPMFQTWLGGLTLPQYAGGDTGEEMALAAESQYRPPDWLADTMFDRGKREFLQGFNGQGQHELAYGAPDFVLTGGGHGTECPQPTPIGCVGSGNDPGTVEPIVLIPRRGVPSTGATFFTAKYDDLVHIFSLGNGRASDNGSTCLDRNFACGPNVFVPKDLVKDSPDCTVLINQPNVVLPDTVLRFDHSCNRPGPGPNPLTAIDYDGDCFFAYTGRFRQPQEESSPEVGMGFIVTHSCSPSASESETTHAFHAFVDYMRTTGRATGGIDQLCGTGGEPGELNAMFHIDLKVPPATPPDLTGIAGGHSAHGTQSTCQDREVTDGGLDGRLGSGQQGIVSGELTMDGDSRYTPTRLLVGPRVISRPHRANVAALAENTSYYGETVALEATVTPNGGRTGAGGSVTFYDGVLELGTVPVGPAGDGGVVKATLTTSALRVGRHQFTAGYSGDARFNVSVSEVEHTVVKAPTTLAYTGAPDGTYHEQAAVAATLTNAATGAPIADAPVGFTLNGQESCAQHTDAAGAAACMIIPNEPAGDYPLAFSYAGDDNYVASSGQRQLTIHKERTALTYTGTTHIANATPARLSAVLKEDGVIGRAPIAGRGVTLALGAGTSRQSCAASTDETGTAACTIDAVDQPLSDDATVPMTATFDGDPYYLPSTTATSVKLQYMTGRAHGLSAGVHIPLVSLDLGPTPDTGPIRTASASISSAPCAASVIAIVLTSHNICEQVTTTVNPGTVTATSTATDTTIGVPGIAVIAVTGVRAESISRCGVSTGNTTIATLSIAGALVTIPAEPNSTIDLAGGARLVINEQKPVPGADNGLTINAIHLTGLAGTVDITIGSANSAVHNCPLPAP